MKFSISLSVLLLLIIFYAAPAAAQRGFVAAGGNTPDGGRSMSFSVGQVDYASEVRSGIMAVNHGLQQPYEIDATSSTSFVFRDLDITFFPNPAGSDLNIRCNTISAGGMEYAVTDAQGRLLNKGKLAAGLNNVSIGDLLPGAYFIRITTSSNEIKSFKLIKQ